MTMTTPPSRISDLLISKVPQVTLAFWVVKVASTTVGETGADFLNADLGLGLVVTTSVTAVLFLGALAWQFATKRYTPAVYWLTVVLISVMGTLITDNLTDSLGVPLWLSTAVFAALLAATFVVWFLRERTLSIHSIVTRRREAFYWLAILFTFALGTAAGDFFAEGLGMGFAVAAIVFGAAIGVVMVAYFAFKANAVVCFWIAYVLTRPLGAAIGDLMSQKPAHGGLGLGAAGTSYIDLAIIVALVIAMSVRVRRERRAVETRLDAGLDLAAAG